MSKEEMISEIEIYLSHVIAKDFPLPKAIRLMYEEYKKQQKEIEDLKAITREYDSYKLGEGNKIMIASKEWFNNGYFEEHYISKDKIRDIIFEFIPKSNHEVELRTKIIKLLGE